VSARIAENRVKTIKLWLEQGSWGLFVNILKEKKVLGEETEG
jgi:hypothetical protein